MHVSEDMLMGYRTGRYQISAKAWRKLEQAEIAAGLRAAPFQGVEQTLNAAPPDVRAQFLGPDTAWNHYLQMEVLLDHLLQERAGKHMSPDELLDFSETLQTFARHRTKARRALLDALKLAGKVGELALAQHMLSQAEHAAADRDLERARAEGKFKTEAPPGQKNRPA